MKREIKRGVPPHRHVAIGIFQGEADWDVTVRVGGFSSEQAASRYAGNFRIRLENGRLYRSPGDGRGKDGEPWIEVPDADVSLTRLSPAARDRIAQAHQEFQARGMNSVAMALQSIKDFEETGSSPLVMMEEDYEPVVLPIAEWHKEDGLTCGFGGLACGVDVED